MWWLALLTIFDVDSLIFIIFSIAPVFMFSFEASFHFSHEKNGLGYITFIRSLIGCTSRLVKVVPFIVELKPICDPFGVVIFNIPANESIIRAAATHPLHHLTVGFGMIKPII